LAIAHAFDVQNDDEVHALVAAVIAHYGAVDIRSTTPASRWATSVCFRMPTGRACLGSICGDRFEPSVPAATCWTDAPGIVNIASAAGLIARRSGRRTRRRNSAWSGFRRSLRRRASKGIGVSVACPMWVRTAINEVRRPARG
jgi:NAD(P)-dependent dehydrogenase (short-subunit alcohol dehydrogenase family)